MTARMKRMDRKKKGAAATSPGRSAAPRLLANLASLIAMAHVYEAVRRGETAARVGMEGYRSPAAPQLREWSTALRAHRRDFEWTTRSLQEQAVRCRAALFPRAQADEPWRCAACGRARVSAGQGALHGRGGPRAADVAAAERRATAACPAAQPDVAGSLAAERAAAAAAGATRDGRSRLVRDADATERCPGRRGRRRGASARVAARAAHIARCRCGGQAAVGRRPSLARCGCECFVACAARRADDADPARRARARWPAPCAAAVSRPPAAANLCPAATRARAGACSPAASAGGRSRSR